MAETHGDGIAPQKASYETDVVIIGCGPIGATYAKLLVDAGYKVVVAERGTADSQRKDVAYDGREVWIPGAHRKNEMRSQEDIDQFAKVAEDALRPVSVSAEDFTYDSLNPSSWEDVRYRHLQQAVVNPSTEAVTTGVGGMTSHWTCSTPRFHPDIELPFLVDSKKDNAAAWQRLYDQAEALIGTTTAVFDESIKHTLVLRTLQHAYEGQRVFEPLPLACRRTASSDNVHWNATDTTLQDVYCDPVKKARFTLLTNHSCNRLVAKRSDARTRSIDFVELQNNSITTPAGNLSQPIVVRAKHFVVAAGAVATPQLLYKSFSSRSDEECSLIPNLGKYITAQPMAFCQIVLNDELLASIPKNPYKLEWWVDKVVQGSTTTSRPNDTLSSEPSPQVTSPVSPSHPWHTQIQRDAYSDATSTTDIDSRTVVDFRFFSYVDPREINKVTFARDMEDGYGMPLPSFRLQLGEDDLRRAYQMKDDMRDVASNLGEYVPGSEPQFVHFTTPGLALHLGGTVRAGLDAQTHVANTNCKVYGFDNLYVGGNGVIPTGFAANPTLTSMGYAIRSAQSIIDGL